MRGERKRQKSTFSLFASFFLLPPRERDFLKLLFRGKAECSRFLFSLTCLSCVFFKKWPKIDLCFGLFFCTPEKANERFLPRNHSQTTSSFLYLCINSFTHNNTYYKTTRIKIHHSERRRRAKKRKRDLVFAAALSLSHISAVVVWTTQKSARVCSFLFLKAKFIKSSFCPLWII